MSAIEVKNNIKKQQSHRHVTIMSTNTCVHHPAHS